MLKVRELRNLRGMKQVELAEKAQIAQAYLSEIENGKTEPSLSVLKRLADVLEVSVSELIGETPPKKEAM